MGSDPKQVNSSTGKENEPAQWKIKHVELLDKDFWQHGGKEGGVGWRGSAGKAEPAPVPSALNCTRICSQVTF